MKSEMLGFALWVTGLDPMVHLKFEYMDINPMNPYSHTGAPSPLPRLDRPFGGNPNYAMHPELSRRVVPGALLVPLAPVIVAAYTTVAVTELYDYAVVRNAPAEEESFWWRVWSSGLTGFGVGGYY